MSGSQIAPKEVMAFLISEARLLDERRWEEWLALFAKDGWYWVPIEEKQSNPKTTISLMYDDRKYWKREYEGWRWLASLTGPGVPNDPHC